MEFLGGRSQPLLSNRRNETSQKSTFCTMPVKVVFNDRNSRINFEKTLTEYSGMRASQSYPKQIRNEMTLFRNALLARYPGMLIMTRPAPSPALELISFKKKDGDKRWEKLSETHALPLNLMLDTYSAPNHLLLPELPDCDSVNEFLDARDSVEGPTGGSLGSQSGMNF